jgi:hypothetical protein
MTELIPSPSAFRPLGGLLGPNHRYDNLFYQQIEWPNVLHITLVGHKNPGDPQKVGVTRVL